MVTTRTLKVTEYPLIHQMHLNFEMSADDASRTKSGTIIPVVYSDEAQQAGAKHTNPRAPAFAPMDFGACCSQSRINSVSGSLTIDMTKNAWNSDKLRNLKVVIIPIAVSFEDLETIDEKTTTTIKAILELQSESTDRQTYPIYNGTDLTGTVRNLGAGQLGLTTDEKIEGVAFDMQQMYDALTWYTNGAKLSKCIGKIQQRTVSMSQGSPTNVASDQGRGIVKFRINLPDKVKSMNPYAFFGLLIYIPQLGTESQYGIAGDTTPGDHLHLDLRLQFLEWNQNFQFSMNPV